MLGHLKEIINFHVYVSCVFQAISQCNLNYFEIKQRRRMAVDVTFVELGRGRFDTAFKNTVRMVIIARA